MIKICKEDQIYNPATRRCVKRSGKTGKLLVRNQHGIQVNSNKSKGIPNINSVHSNKKSIQVDVHSNPFKLGNSLNTSVKKVCKEDQIYNPATRRCVKRSGKTGKLLVINQHGIQVNSVKKVCKEDQIYNPATRRCVKRNGKTGKLLVINQHGIHSNKNKGVPASINSVHSNKNMSVPASINKSLNQNNTESKQLAMSLFDDGIVVLPVEWVSDDILHRFRKGFEKTCGEFPEFKHPVKDNDYVLGGFSALNNPSSFHNQFVRDLRMWSMWTVVPMLKHLANGRKLEQVIDRMLYRPYKQQASAETYHRDEAVNALIEDDVFGGWWNLDSTNQYFSCVPKTHKVVSKHKGFVPIKNKNEIAQYKSEKVLVKIPPGHIMVFYEKLVHEIVPKPAPKNGMIRLFLGWRLTNANDSLFTDLKLESDLKKQAVMQLKSNQVPPMYAKLHWTNWRDKIVSFSTNIQDVCKELKTVKSGKNKNKQLFIVHREMKSLQEYGLPMYTSYYEHEKNILKPNKKWVLHQPGVSSFNTHNKRHTLTF